MSFTKSREIERIEGERCPQANREPSVNPKFDNGDDSEISSLLGRRVARETWNREIGRSRIKTYQRNFPCEQNSTKIAGENERTRDGSRSGLSETFTNSVCLINCQRFRALLQSDVKLHRRRDILTRDQSEEESKNR